MADRCGLPGSGSFPCVSVPFISGETKPNPTPIGCRCLLSKNVEVPVIGANLVKDALRVVPLVQHRFDEIMSSFELEPNRSFVSFSARITLHTQLHQFHYRPAPCGHVSSD